MQTWIGQPADEYDIDEDITLAAGPGTDWFRDPRAGTVTASAPVLVVAEGRTPVTVSCRVGVDLRHTFDAAALFVHHDDEHWTKFAIEQAPDGAATLVSVRTAGTSDDANHRTLPRPDCALRVSVDDRTVSLHARVHDEDPWSLIRHAALPGPSAARIGLLVQSPTGDGARATFRHLRVTPDAVEDIRDGS